MGQSSSVRVGDSGFFYFIWFHQTFTKMLPNFISIFWYKDVNDYRFIIHLWLFVEKTEVIHGLSSAPTSFCLTMMMMILTIFQPFKIAT